MLTEQEVFDKVVSRLMDGTGRALVNEQLSMCTYLNEDGNKCAVGIFLPDNEEMQSFEGDVYDLVDEFKDHLDFPQEIIEYKRLLGNLQNIHDREEFWNDNEFIGYNILEETASKFNLKYERPSDVN